MRLISLVANQPSFHAVNFHRSGLSLIVSRRESIRKGNESDTYNGTGKSLLIALIHFCLGSNANKEFERKLGGWEFTLEFAVGAGNYEVRRATSEQGVLWLNDAKLSLQKFRQIMVERVFPSAGAMAHLSFRSLISAFIRPTRAAYERFDTLVAKEKDYTKLVRNGFLLGMDMDLIAEKHRLREEHTRITTSQANLEKDELLRSFFIGERDLDIDLRYLEEKARALEADLKEFKIADNYHEVEQEADALTRRLQELNNEQLLLEESLHAIQKSLKSKPDVQPERLVALYEEARVSIPAAVVKTLEEVQHFNERLLSGRQHRLTREKVQIQDRIKQLKVEIRQIADDRDHKLGFLNAHGALDEFVKLNGVLADCRQKAQKLRDYRDLRDKYSNALNEIKAALAHENTKTTEYLRGEGAAIIRENMDRFFELANRFYPGKPSGLTVNNNSSDRNQLRFNIDAKIQDDASDGINEVKIFCFDMTLLLTHRQHGQHFVFHDSRLFSDIDAKMRATLFKVAHTLARKHDFQYIASLNQDQIDGMREFFNNDEFEAIFGSRSVVLELKDQSPTDKLLGVQIDMRYDDAHENAPDTE
jgi:uncharacterized protein YydD (DUF2326 family)